MSNSDRCRFKPTNRRNFLKYGGALGAAMFGAGCSGGNGDKTPTPINGDDGSDGGGSQKDATLRVWRAGTEVISNLQWNPYNSSTAGTGSHQAGGYLYDFLVFHAPNTDELFPNILKEYSVDPSGGETTIDMQFREDYYWHNGDQLTAHDYATQIRLDMEYTKATSPKARPHVYIKELMEVDDFFVRIKLHDNMAKKFAVVRALGGEQMLIKRDAGGDPRTYEEWVKDLRKADGSKAEQIAAELSEWRQENPIGNGVWKVKEATDSAILLEVHKDHPAADTINFPNIEIVQMEDGPRAFLDGQVDAITARMPVPKDLQNEMPESVAKFNDDFDQCIHVAFNNGNTKKHDPVTADVDVRRAMAYIVNNSVYETNTPVAYKAVPLPNSSTNIAPGTDDQLDFSLDDFVQYKSSEEKALEHLEKAGYTRENGQVVDSNGNTPEVNIVAATGISDSFLIHGQTTAKLLERFGFKVKLESLDNAGFSERRFAGTYDIIPDLDPFLGPVVDNEPAGWDDWYSDLMHLPETYDLPMPIGATGNQVKSHEEFDLIEMMGKWQATGDDAVFKKIVWFFNSMVPRVTPIVGPDAGRLNTAGNWNVDNTNTGLTQMRPGMKNAFRFDDDGARVYYEE